MQTQSVFKTQPTPYKFFFQSQGIPISKISNRLNLSYPYLSLVINGNSRLSSNLKKKLDDIVIELGGNLEKNVA